MTRYTRVRLAPAGPFHFGGRGVGLEHSDVGLGADSLFSALCVTIAQHFSVRDLEWLLARFGAGGRTPSPPFRLTSLMPCAGSVYFLPMPQVGPAKTPGAADIGLRKRFKDVVWVSEAVFRVLVRGEDMPRDALEGDQPLTIHGGKVWLTAVDKASLLRFVARDPETDEEQEAVLWRTARRPRATVDRRTSASAVFRSGATYFNQAENAKVSLYTMIEWLDADEKLRTFMRHAFARLGEAGLGGGRSHGHGRFEAFGADRANWDIGATDGTYFTTLAPYHPAAGENAVLGVGARYEIKLRRGWLSLAGYAGLRRASVRMVGEGSVLRRPAGWALTSILGDITDVSPQTLLDMGGPRVYRAGLAFPVGVADAAMQEVEP